MKARSVPFWRRIRNCSGVSRACHSSSVCGRSLMGNTSRDFATGGWPPRLILSGVSTRSIRRGRSSMTPVVQSPDEGERFHRRAARDPEPRLSGSQSGGEFEDYELALGAATVDYHVHNRMDETITGLEGEVEFAVVETYVRPAGSVAFIPRGLHHGFREPRPGAGPGPDPVHPRRGPGRILPGAGEVARRTQPGYRRHPGAPGEIRSGAGRRRPVVRVDGGEIIMPYRCATCCVDLRIRQAG